jgi:hypothetical protein
MSKKPRTAEAKIRCKEEHKEILNQMLVVERMRLEQADLIKEQEELLKARKRK